MARTRSEATRPGPATEEADMPDDSPLTMPTTRLTIEYGLDEQGEPIIGECWENLTNPDDDVDMITKAGLLTMAQQTLTLSALGLDDD